MDMKQTAAFTALLLIGAAIYAAVIGSPTAATELVELIGFTLGLWIAGALFALVPALILCIFKQGFWHPFLMLWGICTFPVVYAAGYSM